MTERTKEVAIIIILILGLCVGAYVISEFMGEDREVYNSTEFARDYIGRVRAGNEPNETYEYAIGDGSWWPTEDPNELSTLEIDCPCGLQYEVMGRDLCYSRKVIMLTDISEPNDETMVNFTHDMAFWNETDENGVSNAEWMRRSNESARKQAEAWRKQKKEDAIEKEVLIRANSAKMLHDMLKELAEPNDLDKQIAERDRRAIDNANR